MDFQFERHFTVEEANAMIPHVQRLFREVTSLMISPGAEEFLQPNGAHITGNGNGNGNGNSHDKPPANYDHWSEEKRHEAAYRLLHALQQQGIIIQDVERGLIDFPAIRDGREVFLCYELKDGHFIQYFHDLDAGFAGRKKLTENPGE